MNQELTLFLGPTLTWVVPVLLGYLLGSIPSGYLIARFMHGVDIREHGSGNIGFTNVFRVLGFTPGMVVLVADMLKGWVAVQLAIIFVPPQSAELMATALPVLAGLAAIIGHSFSIFLGMKGGKGVATAGGIIIALMPIAALIIIVVWGLTLVASRYVSLASVTAALTFPAAVFLLDQPVAYLLFALFASLLVIVRHWANIGRLIRKEEFKFQFKRTSDSGGSKLSREDATP